MLSFSGLPDPHAGPPAFEGLKLTVENHSGGIALMPVTLTTAMQPVPTASVTYTRSETKTAFQLNGGNSKDYKNLYSFGLYGRDFSLDSEI